MTSKLFFKMLGNIKHYHHIVIRLKLGEDKRLLKKGYLKAEYDRDLLILIDFWDNGNLRNLIWDWMGVKLHESISACAVPSSESIKYLLIDVRGHENNIKT
jgi:hypothetical protein